MAEPIIQLVNLTKKYGEFTAVNNLNLTVEKGEIFGLLGPNGAGKSTTILMMLGLTEPFSGTVSVCGIDSTSQPIEVKKKVGFLPEDVGFYEERSGLENLVYTAQLNGISKSESEDRAEHLLGRVGLHDERNKKTGKYSKGMRQRLGLADVLIKDPEVIILDEPTSGIDPQGVQNFLNLIVELRNEHGISVLFSSHDLHQVQQVCDRVGIFVAGQLLASGDLQSLSKQLFNRDNFLIELGIDENSTNRKNGELSGTWLQNLLEPISGIESVSKDKALFQIRCSTDVSAQIAEKIIDEGLGLRFLHRKEYGLDAIYNRYFEGHLNDH